MVKYSMWTRMQPFYVKYNLEVHTQTQYGLILEEEKSLTLEEVSTPVPKILFVCDLRYSRIFIIIWTVFCMFTS